MNRRVSALVLVLLTISLIACSTSAPATQSPAPANNPQPTQAAAPTNVPATEEPTAASSGGSAGGTADAGTKVSGSLNLVIGTKDRPSVYPSYHLESTVTTPGLSDDSTKVVVKTIKIAADVQGDNVHLSYTAPDSDQAKEGYIIGENEYRMTDGKPEEMMGQIALSWAGWHLAATFPFSAAASLSSKTGAETIDGRQADVYTVDTSKLDPAVLEGFRTFGMFPITNMQGTIWIDQQTGGALKAVVDYQLDVMDPNTEKLVGNDKGHLDLSITKIDQVTVTQP